MPHRRLGLALGSGSARGWAHIGVIRALEERGLVPDVICGTSVGGLVGATWAAGRLDEFEAWLRKLTRRDVMGFLDVSLSGGLFAGRRLFDYLAKTFLDVDIEDLHKPFACVATDLATGQEMWLRSGSVLKAVRASIAIPGIFTPVWHEERWLVDGGLVNPVPVSLCRALGADQVIAVDLHTVLLGRNFSFGAPAQDAPKDTPPGVTPTLREPEAGESPSLWRRVQERSRELMARAQRDAPAEEAGAATEPQAAGALVMAPAVTVTTAPPPAPAPPPTPSVFEVMANAVDVMQVRIGRSRMAGDPPELLITPRLPDVGILDYYRAAEAIEEGRRATERALALYGPAFEK